MKSMGISYAAHRYAPEQFTGLKVYSQPFALDSDKLWKLGYLYSTKGREACVAEIKRIYRASLKKRRKCTIGFMLKDSRREYCFTRGLSAYDDDLSAKLRIYKEFKRDMLERGCAFESGSTAKLGAGYKVEHVESIVSEADLSRLVKIYFR